MAIRIMTFNPTWPKLMSFSNDKVTRTEVYDNEKDPTEKDFILEAVEIKCIGLKEEPNEAEISELEAQLRKKYNIQS